MSQSIQKLSQYFKLLELGRISLFWQIKHLLLLKFRATRFVLRNSIQLGRFVISIFTCAAIRYTYFLLQMHCRSTKSNNKLHNCTAHQMTRSFVLLWIIISSMYISHIYDERLADSMTTAMMYNTVSLTFYCPPFGWPIRFIYCLRLNIAKLYDWVTSLHMFFPAVHSTTCLLIYSISQTE